MMKITTQICLFALVLSLSSLPVFSQKRANSKKPRKAVLTQESNSKFAPVESRVFNHQEKITVSYDKFENETTVRLEMPLSAERGTLTSPSPLSIAVSFEFKGDKLNSPPKQIYFSVIKNVWRGLESAFPKQPNILNFIFLADSTRLTYSGISVRELKQIPLTSRSYLEDVFVTLLTYRQFLQLVNSDDVEFKVGYLQTRLNLNHLEALRDFASRMNVNAKKQPNYTTKPNPTQKTETSADLAGQKEKLIIQIKNLSKFISLLGSVASEIEEIDRKARNNTLTRIQFEKLQKAKQAVINSMRSLNLGLTSLEKILLSNPSLQSGQVRSISDLSTSALNQAEAGRFTDSGKTYSTLLDTLTDILGKMP